MTDGRGTVREIQWLDICPWLILFRAFRIAISFRVLVLASVAVILMTFGWGVIGGLFSGSRDELVQEWIKVHGVWPWEAAEQARPTSAARPNVPTDGNSAPDQIDALTQRIPIVGHWLLAGPIAQVWQTLSNPFFRLFHPEIGFTGLAYLFLCCLWAIIIWSIFAGAITRIAALALVREEAMGLKPSLLYWMSKWRSYLIAPLMPLGGMLFAVIPLTILGLLMRLDPLLPIVGLLWPLVLLAGLFLAVVLLGILAGWPLLWPTISFEGTDEFDALSRSYSYTYQRPLHYLFYISVASLLGIIGVLVVDTFAAGVLSLSEWSLGWGSGGERLSNVLDTAATDEGRFFRIGSAMISFWTGTVSIVQAAFRFGFFWTSVAAIYLLLRRDVDATDMDEITLEEEETYGLPPLTTDENGIPEVVDEEDATQ